MRKENIARFLTYAGLVPFLALTLIQGLHLSFFTFNNPQIILAYGAVIASFVSGIHWGVYLFKDAPVNLFIHSNVVALLAWLCLLCPPLISYLLLIICFLYLLGVDRKLYKADILTKWFWKLRVQATIIVIISLSVNILFLTAEFF